MKKIHHVVLVAKAFSLYAAMKDKDAQTTPGMSSAQPSRVSDEGRGAPFEVTLSVPQTLVGLLARMRL